MRKPKLVPNAKAVAKRSWSFRLNAVGAVLGAAELGMSVFAASPPISPAVFATVYAAVNLGGMAARLAERIGEGPRTLSRWRVGEGKPSTRTMSWTREWALRTAAEVLAAAGEQDLADGVLDRHRAIRHRAAERGRAAFEAAVAARSSVSGR